MANKAESLGMNEDQFAFFGILETLQMPTEQAKDLASAIFDALKALAVIDWKNKEDVQREMRRQVKQLLRVAGIRSSLEELANGILDLAHVRLVQ